MTKQEMVLNVLNVRGCLTASEIAGMGKRRFGYELSPQSAGAVVRQLVAKGYAGNSRNEKNQLVYWLTTPLWEIEKEMREKDELSQ